MSRTVTRLPNEIPEDEWIKLRPHPLSFMYLYILTLFLIAWGLFLYWFFNDSSQWSGFEDNLNNYVGEGSTFNVAGNASAATALWFVVLLAVGFIASHIWIEKGGYKFFFVFLFIGLVGIGAVSYVAKTQGKNGIIDFYKWFIPWSTVAFGAIGTLLIDYYRRGYRYILTNLRIIMAKKFITLDERIVRYNHIEDVQVGQGLIGRIFGFGNVTPLTGSGIATGTDESIAMGTVGKEVEGVNVGVAGGSKKSVRKAKAGPGDCLYGVKNPTKIRSIISKYIQENTGVTVMKRQEETLGRIEQLLASQAKGSIPSDDSENN